MRALEPEVVDAVFAAIEPLLPEPPEHPLGCHRPRISDRLCFWGFLIRLTTGSSWVDIEAILEHRVSDTTLRTRRDEWIDAGVFDQLCAEAIAAFDRIIGLDLSEFAIDGSLHKAPYGGEGTGANPTDRGKLGWKWSIGVDRHGIPLGWAIDGANRNDVRLLEPTLDAIAAERLARRDRHHPPRPRLRLPQDPTPTRRCRPRRSRHPTPPPTRRSPTQDDHARAALDRRSHQLLAVELRPTPPQHRPQELPPPRRTLPRHHRAHRRQTPHLARPLGPTMTPPIRSSPKWCFCQRWAQYRRGNQL